MINAEQWKQRRFLDALRGFLGIAPLYCLENDATPMVALMGDGCKMSPRTTGLSERVWVFHEKYNPSHVRVRPIDRRISPQMRDMQRRRYGND